MAGRCSCGASGFGVVSAGFSAGGAGVCFLEAEGRELSACCAKAGLEISAKTMIKTEVDIPRSFFILIPVHE